MFWGNRNPPTDECDHGEELACIICNPQLLRPTEQGKRALQSLGITVAELNPSSGSLSRK